jgi:CheY-like chemotaxis protein
MIAAAAAALFALGEKKERSSEPSRYSPALSVAHAAKKTSILIVDDSAVARAKLSKLFDKAGYRVDVAMDGVEALKKLFDTDFQLLITDIEMPNMDGFNLIAEVQSSMDTENIPIIAVTGHPELQAKVHNLKGVFGIFGKPWNDRELLRHVQMLLAANRQ